MTPSQIHEGEELLEKATQGNWINCHMPDDEAVVGVEESLKGDALGVHICKGMTGPNRHNNAAFIAWIKNHASELLQAAREVERMKEEKDCGCRYGYDLVYRCNEHDH